jgi:hypothetical protein
MKVNTTGSRAEISLLLKQIENPSATYKLGFDKFTISGNSLLHIA